MMFNELLTRSSCSRSMEQVKKERKRLGKLNSSSKDRLPNKRLDLQSWFPYMRPAGQSHPGTTACPRRDPMSCERHASVELLAQLLSSPHHPVRVVACINREVTNRGAVDPRSCQYQLHLFQVMALSWFRQCYASDRRETRTKIA